MARAFAAAAAALAALAALAARPASAIPSTPYNFSQRVDHFSERVDVFDQRYYMNATSFGGPGFPIICILGGEPRCPVITVGGSYPGWLSFAMRLRYPAVVDIAYAGSAPVRFYSEEVGQYDYYRVITDSAARANASCPDAVRAMLGATIGAPGVTKADITTNLNMCAPLPQYMQDG